MHVWLAPNFITYKFQYYICLLIVCYQVLGEKGDSEQKMGNLAMQNFLSK